MIDASGIIYLLEKHAPKRPRFDPREIKLTVARSQIGTRKAVPSYVVNTIKEEYERTKSLRKTADVFGCDHSNIGRILLKRGLNKPRNTREKIIHNGLPYSWDQRRYFIYQKRGLPPKFLHRVIWEEAHGPIPKGSFLVFKTSNHRDFSLDNMKILSGLEYRHHILSFRKDRRERKG